MLCQAPWVEGTSAQGDEHFSFIETLPDMCSYTRAQTLLYYNKLNQFLNFHYSLRSRAKLIIMILN